MKLRIQYRPSTLSFDEFHPLDLQCFPRELIRPETFAGTVSKDFWAAYEGNSLVGFSYLTRKPDVAWISRIGIAADHRRRGIGSQLMRAMMEHCRRLGLEDLLLYVQCDNEAAIHMYDHLDFGVAESAYQFVLPDARRLSWRPSSVSITAAPIVDLPKRLWPSFPREWVNIADSHDPPDQYVLIFVDDTDAVCGYCKLSPGFPGCFPFVVEQPARNLGPILASLSEYLLPNKDELKLTFSADDTANACDELGLKLNYRLHKMIRPADRTSS